MLIETKQIKLKDGRTAVLRSPEIEDAKEVLESLVQSLGETSFLRFYPEEWKDNTIEGEEAFLRNQRENDRGGMVVCEVDGRLVGNCSLTGQMALKMKHRGEIGIALLRGYWGLGIGTAMMEEIAVMAKEIGISQLELEVYDANERGLRLYEKMGFERVATIPNAAILKDGTVFDAHIMMRQVG